MAKLVNDHPVHWVEVVPQVRMAYVSRLHRAIGVSPFEMLHGCAPKLATPAGFAIMGSLEVSEAVEANDHLSYLQQRFEQLDAQALALIKAQFKRNKLDWQRRRSDFTRKSKHALCVGDLVLEIDDNPETAWNAAVRGPYMIVSLS